MMNRDEVNRMAKALRASKMRLICNMGASLNRKFVEAFDAEVARIYTTSNVTERVARQRAAETVMRTVNGVADGRVLTYFTGPQYEVEMENYHPTTKQPMPKKLLLAKTIDHADVRLEAGELPFEVVDAGVADILLTQFGHRNTIKDFGLREWDDSMFPDLIEQIEWRKRRAAEIANPKRVDPAPVTPRKSATAAHAA